MDSVPFILGKESKARSKKARFTGEQVVFWGHECGRESLKTLPFPFYKLQHGTVREGPVDNCKSPYA